MWAEILTIGDELCRGEIVDTNSSWLAAELWDLDVTTRWMTSVRDDADDMRGAFTQAAGRADLVVCSGGLGPTEDDLTVDVVSELTGSEPEMHEPSRQRMEARFGPRASHPKMLRQVRGNGTLVPEQIQFVQADTDGRVERIFVLPGAEVKSDTILLELSNPELKQAAFDAEWQLKAAEALLTKLKVQLESENKKKN